MAPSLGEWPLTGLAPQWRMLWLSAVSAMFLGNFCKTRKTPLCSLYPADLVAMLALVLHIKSCHVQLLALALAFQHSSVARVVPFVCFQACAKNPCSFVHVSFAALHSLLDTRARITCIHDASTCLGWNTCICRNAQSDMHNQSGMHSQACTIRYATIKDAYTRMTMVLGM